MNNAIKIKTENISSIVNNYKSHHFLYIFLEKNIFLFLLFLLKLNETKIKY